MYLVESLRYRIVCDTHVIHMIQNMIFLRYVETYLHDTCRYSMDTVGYNVILFDTL